MTSPRALALPRLQVAIIVKPDDKLNPGDPCNHTVARARALSPYGIKYASLRHAGATAYRWSARFVLRGEERYVFLTGPPPPDRPISTEGFATESPLPRNNCPTISHCYCCHVRMPTSCIGIHTTYANAISSRTYGVYKPLKTSDDDVCSIVFSLGQRNVNTSHFSSGNQTDML